MSQDNREKNEDERPNLHAARFLRGLVLASDMTLYHAIADVYQLRDTSYRGVDPGPLVTALHHEDLQRLGSRETEPEELVLFSVPVPGGIKISKEREDPLDSFLISTGPVGGYVRVTCYDRQRDLTVGDTLALDFIGDMNSNTSGYLYYLPQIDPETLLSDATGPLKATESPKGPHYLSSDIPIGATVFPRRPVALYVNAGQTSTHIEHILPKRF